MVGVKFGGEGDLGSGWGSLMDDWRRVEDETLCSAHMGGQSGAHGMLWLQSKNAARSRSCEAAKASWMVVMAAKSVEEAGGGAIDNGAMLAHVVLVWTGKPVRSDRVAAVALQG